MIESASGDAAEIGVVGREGIASAPGALSFPHNPVTEMMQIAGNGYRINAGTMRRILKESVEIRELVHRHALLLAMRVAQIAGCNAMHSAEQRLARWLLMVNDRVQANPLPLTQEFLSILLGVSRQSVSVTANALREKGAIRLGRESVEIISRTTLEQCSCECYAIISTLTLRLPT